MDNRKAKLNDKSESFVFIGYDSSSMRYELYNPNNKNIIISRDVIFDEEGEWDFGPQVDNFNFFPFFEKEPIVERARDAREESFTSPIIYTHSPPSFLNERNEGHTRNLQDLYEGTKSSDNLILFCLFAKCKLMSFEEAA